MKQGPQNGDSHEPQWGANKEHGKYDIVENQMEKNLEKSVGTGIM